MSNINDRKEEQGITVISPKDIAARLHKSLHWVYDHGFELGGIRIGGSWIFTEEALKVAIQSRQRLQSESCRSGPALHELKTYQKRSPGLRKRKAKGVITGEPDPYGIFD